MSDFSDLEQKGFALAQIFQNMGNALKPADLESGWFYHLIIDLMKASLLAYERLASYYVRHEYHLLSGACRNLLELAIITKYVLLSEADARKFCEDRLIDGVELLTALKKLELYYDPQCETSNLDLALKNFEDQMAAENVAMRKHLDLKDLAAKVGMTDEYLSINRVCSKLVHGCAWSVMAVNEEINSFPDGRDLYMGTGIMFLSMVHIAIREHEAAHGIRPLKAPVLP